MWQYFAFCYPHFQWVDTCPCERLLSPDCLKTVPLTAVGANVLTKLINKEFPRCVVHSVWKMIIWKYFWRHFQNQDVHQRQFKKSFILKNLWQATFCASLGSLMDNTGIYLPSLYITIFGWQTLRYVTPNNHQFVPKRILKKTS